MYDDEDDVFLLYIHVGKMDLALRRFHAKQRIVFL